MDDRRYGETGREEPATAHGVDLAGVARAGGFKYSKTTSSLKTLRSIIHEGAGPNFAVVKVVAEKLPLVLPPLDGVALKDRFRRALLGDSAEVLSQKR